MKMHKDTAKRIEWLQELYITILQKVNDPDVAKIIYRRVVFEEQR